ncbi:hypothetical protein [Deinococcus aquiradiocola]|uniref:Secreted protein n=1 Tax=Deinococcus aquiradiocola TaxID=393059 RepID=A0A917UML9_9DEIO|nr:hypothetical protein [Deinococcus aquiradiocola]GGJ68429.1 hypothetical protein GCM10008939_11060 [Deinococcus aquiradiocola]
MKYGTLRRTVLLVALLGSAGGMVSAHPDTQVNPDRWIPLPIPRPNPTPDPDDCHQPPLPVLPPLPSS